MANDLSKYDHDRLLILENDPKDQGSLTNVKAIFIHEGTEVERLKLVSIRELLLIVRNKVKPMSPFKQDGFIDLQIITKSDQPNWVCSCEYFVKGSVLEVHEVELVHLTS